MQNGDSIHKFRGRGYQFFAWIVFYYFWYRYFVVGEERLTAHLFSAITTFFAASVFYITVYWLVPSQSKNVKAIWVIITAAIFAIVISFFRTISILAVVRLFPGKDQSFHFMGQYFTSLFHISSVLVFAMVIQLYADKQKEQLKSEKEMKERLSAELEFLKSQVNPHFLFNIHNSIYFLIRDDPRKAETAILMLSEIMRYQIYECNQEFVPLEKELHNISNYIELEKIRHGNTIKVEYSLDGKESEFKIAPFILLLLIENAFKHISAFTDKPNFIDIKSGIKENFFFMNVVNSIEQATETNRKQLYSAGTGLKNLLRRLELIYSDQHELILSKGDDLFTASLKIKANDTEKPDR